MAEALGLELGCDGRQTCGALKGGRGDSRVGFWFDMRARMRGFVECRRSRRRRLQQSRIGEQGCSGA